MLKGMPKRKYRSMYRIDNSTYKKSLQVVQIF